MNAYFNKYTLNQILKMREDYQGTEKHGAWFFHVFSKIILEIPKSEDNSKKTFLYIKLCELCSKDIHIMNRDLIVTFYNSLSQFYSDVKLNYEEFQNNEENMKIIQNYIKY